ncbi:unnamed protein product [Kluyveromyces dobzhanskii CBS 2104]|uniref:WGS project CCBQ000000000 data, contig 00015 n=1 Tax=Kluyveromyces dobzhanskii CBS 2104 TaxID=1427455 RepID=A0A0A8LB60_9SACH|nr:unnamed protein product [Kluyveromyces dobzhanskii CBS 2104]
MNALENDKPTGLKFPQLMGMVYRTDFEVPDDIPKAVGIARWLDTQTEGLALDSPDDVEQDQSINSEVSSISEFSSLKTDFVKLLFDNSITNDSDIAALSTLDETIHGQQEQERQEEEHQQEYWQERYEQYESHEQHEHQSSQQAPQRELHEHPESQEHPAEHEHPEEQEHQQERRQELRDQQDLQEHQERASSDEKDGNTLFDLDPIDEMNQIDEEVINMIFTEGVIHEIRYTLQQIQA